MFYESHVITEFKEKAKLLNFFFSKKCPLIPYNSSLPRDVNYITNKRLDLEPKILQKSIQNLDSNKAHGYDNVIISILKMC